MYQLDTTYQTCVHWGLSKDAVSSALLVLTRHHKAGMKLNSAAQNAGFVCVRLLVGLHFTVNCSLSIKIRTGMYMHHKLSFMEIHIFMRVQHKTYINSLRVYLY